MTNENQTGVENAGDSASTSHSSSTVVRVYDQALCCSTGVCGPQVDPALPKFAADLDWLKDQGHDVVRFNLAQDPAQFAQNATVKNMLAEEGVECLPLVFVDDRVVSRSEYPSRENLALWTGTTMKPKAGLPMADGGGCCGGETGCC